MRHDTPEYSLIASALQSDFGVPEPGWDWDRTVEIAAREEVLPTLHAKLACPPEISEFLEAIHELNGERNRHLLRQVETLALLLNAVGIEPVLLKGAAYLVTGVYADPADRWLQDIDLLVGPHECAESFDIICRSGYRSHVPKPTALGRHHYPMLTQDQCAPVEVHHSLGLGACSRFLTADEVVNASTSVRFGCARVRIPSAEHLMTHLIMHSQMHHGSCCRIWPSLRAMLDLVSLARRHTVPWDSIRSRFGFHGQTTLLNLHLKQVQTILGFSPPFPVSDGGVRWMYRQALWKNPTLRYVDPGYVFSRVLLDKIQVSRRLLKDPDGRKFVLSTPFRKSFYKRLFADIAKG